MSNDYENKWAKLSITRNNNGARGEVDYFHARTELVAKYSWAIPNSKAIERIAKSGHNIVEMGAGTGYWASLIFEAMPQHKIIKAYDAEIKNRPQYYPVFEGAPNTLRMFNAPDWALFLCWPPYNTSMAFDALAAFKGDALFYVGEGPGGCTGDDAFFEKLEASWELQETITIPQWCYIHDRLYVYKRAKGILRSAPA